MTTTHQSQRARVLMDQRRYDLASQELRAHLASFPDDAHAHSLLARCLSHLKKAKEAIAEAKTAIAAAPDSGFAHCVLAEILDTQGKYKEAEKAAEAGARIEPENSSYFGVLAQIRLHLGEPRKALEAADAGLTVDSESTTCANMRALALTRLGRAAEAATASNSALRLDPLDPYSHASRGWALLESGKHKQALEHFREALRIDPEMEWARSGMLHALKANYLVYRWFLAWSFFLSRHKQGARYAIIIGLYVTFRVLANVTLQSPTLRPLGIVIAVTYFCLVYLSWTAGPVFNTLLRFNRFGRMLLSREQVIASNFFASYLAAGVVCLIVGILLDSLGMAVAGGGLLLMTLFVGVAAQAKPAGFQRFMIGLGAVLTVVIAAGGVALYGTK